MQRKVMSTTYEATHGTTGLKIPNYVNTNITNTIQWRYSPVGLWPTERPPPVSEASANFCG